MSLSDWTIANPESAGLRSEPLRDLVEWLDGFGQANIHSVLVVRHGRLLFEHYRAGEDQCWGEPLGNVAHGPDSKHDLRSVTKSVISLLFGIALDRKLIGDIDEAIIDWFPQYSDLRTPEKERISLRHLLTMSAGLEWNENVPFTDPKNSEIRMLCSADQCRYALEQPVVAPGGQVWNYNSGCTLLLEAVLAKAAGGALDDVAREFLLEPLGITDFAWTRDSRSGRPATALAGSRKDWPAHFEWRKLEWSPDRFTEMGEGIHGSTYRSCRPHIFLRISMVARAFPGRGTRGAVDLCNGTWRAAHLRCTSARPCGGGYGWTLR
jgi:CubicO group peptidase (beta-lactamase class C family)